MQRILSRLLALSLLAIALLWAYSRNRMTRDEVEALQKQEARVREAEYYRKHPSRKAAKEERDREYDEWMNSLEGQQIAAMTARYLTTEDFEDAIESAITH
ncbi:MAG: hypothetical protein SF029_08240 [bacterium]|nr:hypothetical protein [bacterium]